MAHHYQVNAVWNQYIGNAVQLLQAVFFRCEIVSLRTIFYLICVEVLIFFRLFAVLFLLNLGACGVVADQYSIPTLSI